MPADNYHKMTHTHTHTKMTCRLAVNDWPPAIPSPTSRPFAIALSCLALSFVSIACSFKGTDMLLRQHIFLFIICKKSALYNSVISSVWSLTQLSHMQHSYPLLPLSLLCTQKLPSCLIPSHEHAGRHHTRPSNPSKDPFHAPSPDKTPPRNLLQHH